MVILGCFWSCSIYDPPVKTPSFVSVDSFRFESQTAITGYNTQKITEAWIFVNNQSIGIYSIPTGRIPVLAEGNATIAIGAGVFADAVGGNKVLYPFFKQYEEKVVLTKEKTIHLQPVFAYDDSLKIPFSYYQDFEKSDSGFSVGRFGTLTLERPVVGATGSATSFGNRYGKLTTLSASDVIQYSNDVYLPFRQNGMPVYLEFDYQSTCEIAVGIYGKGSQVELYDLILRPVGTWTKVYVSLSDEAERFANGEKFRFFLRSGTAPGLGNSLSLDNIRLIQF